MGPAYRKGDACEPVLVEAAAELNQVKRIVTIVQGHFRTGKTEKNEVLSRTIPVAVTEQDYQHEARRIFLNRWQGLRLFVTGGRQNKARLNIFITITNKGNLKYGLIC